MKGLVFNIQKYALHDGPGIRTTVFLKGCPLSCQWCHNPESLKLEAELKLVTQKCISCDHCSGFTISQSCPTEALETVGTYYTAEDLFNKVKKDAIFYDESGGGVTISGGEPLMQSDFLLDFLKVLKSHDIHTTVDTSGFADWSVIESLLPYVDLWLYDIKMLDEASHIHLTGVSNLLILENYNKLIQLAKVRVRSICIKGLQDTIDYYEALGDFIKHENLVSIDILPYHGLGEHKYEELIEKQKFTHFERPSDEDLNCLLSILKSKGIPAQIGG